MNYVDRSKWEPVGNLSLEDSALDAVKEESNLLVIAGPGAGKTELLAQKACYLLQTNQCKNPRKILAISFKRDAAENLAERVEKRCGKDLSRRFVSKTFDSFAKSLMDNFYHGIPNDYKPDRSYGVATNENDIVKAFNTAGVRRPPSMKWPTFKTRLNNALVGRQLPLPSETKGDEIIKDVWDSLLKGEIGQSASLTFPMISRVAEYLIRENPLIRKALIQSYSHIFLDEFQDTTEIQYDLLKACFYSSPTSITAVGDSKQLIMIWAGAKENVFEEFQKDFQADEKKLIMNHRSAPRLLEVQKFFTAI